MGHKCRQCGELWKITSAYIACSDTCVKPLSRCSAHDQLGAGIVWEQEDSFKTWVDSILEGTNNVS